MEILPAEQLLSPQLAGFLMEGYSEKRGNLGLRPISARRRETIFQQGEESRRPTADLASPTSAAGPMSSGNPEDIEPAAVLLTSLID